MCLTGLITVLISLCNMMILWVSACGTLKDMEQFSLCPTLLYCSYFILAVSIKCHTSPVSAEPHISVFSFCFVSDWMNLPEFLKNASENVVGLFCFNSDRTWRSLVVLYLVLYLVVLDFHMIFFSASDLPQASYGHLWSGLISKSY